MLEILFHGNKKTNLVGFGKPSPEAPFGISMISDKRAVSFSARRFPAVQEWRAEGRAKGREEGKAEALQRLLERRFGPLSEGRREALRVARPEDLDLWIDRVLDAASIEEVFVATH